VIVVDANIAMGWCIADSLLSPLAVAVRKRHAEIIAPDFIIVEVTNALVLASRSSSASVDYMQSALEQLPRWFSELVPAVSLRGEAFVIAQKLGHPAYDCFYLALAVQRRAKMVTADRKFARRLATTPYAEFIEAIE
jgi:predicted nucleic acid-binding protein